MAPTHIPVFVSQKPSTKYGIVRPAILFLAWSQPREGQAGGLEVREALQLISTWLVCAAEDRVQSARARAVEGGEPAIDTPNG